MGDHEHATAPALADAGDEAEQLALAGDIDTLDRLIKYQQAGRAQQGAGQQNPLQLATGDILDRALSKTSGADLVEGRRNLVAISGAAETKEPRHGQRQGVLHRQALRHIANACSRPHGDLPPARLQ